MESLKVLLIDDEVEFIENISEILQLKGYTVAIAANGEEGINAISEDDFDVIVLDLRMPGLSGMDVLRKIMPSRKTAPEVIILTGFASIDSALEGLQLGAFDYMTKPVKIEALVEKISAAWQRKILKGCS